MLHRTSTGSNNGTAVRTRKSDKRERQQVDNSAVIRYRYEGS